MRLNLNRDELIIILKSIYSDYMHTKNYFKENIEEDKRIGMTTPEEFRELYNNLLKQCEKQGINLPLEFIK